MPVVPEDVTGTMMPPRVNPSVPGHVYPHGHETSSAVGESLMRQQEERNRAVFDAMFERAAVPPREVMKWMAQVFGKVDKDALKAYARRFTERQATDPTPIEAPPEMEPSSSSSSHAQPAGFASHSVPMSEQFKGMMSQGIKNFSGNMANIFRTVTGKLSEEQLDNQLREIEKCRLRVTGRLI